jgi:hypothetical protein
MMIVVAKARIVGAPEPRVQRASLEPFMSAPVTSQLDLESLALVPST